MAQRVNSTTLRLGLNTFWISQWYSTKHYSSLFFEDLLIKFYFKSIFEKRGFYFKECLIKRTQNQTLIFLEIYGNPYFKFMLAKKYRLKKRFKHKILTKNVKNFLKTLTPNSELPYGFIKFESTTHLSINNLFLLNRIHRPYLDRLRGLCYEYKRFKFSIPILNALAIVVKNTNGADFLAKMFAKELSFLEKKKKNKQTWRLIYLLSKIVRLTETQSTSIWGIRAQVQGRFRGIKRPRKMKYTQGVIPFNTLRAKINYATAQSITINGSFGIKIWICYKDNFLKFKDTYGINS
jgi:ribosomal protein S3